MDTPHFSYNYGYVVTNIKALKEQLAMATYEWLQFIDNIMLSYFRASEITI